MCSMNVETYPNVVNIEIYHSGIYREKGIANEPLNIIRLLFIVNSLFSLSLFLSFHLAFNFYHSFGICYIATYMYSLAVGDEGGKKSFVENMRNFLIFD